MFTRNYFFALESDQYSVSAASQVLVLQLALGSQKWYWNISTSHMGGLFIPCAFSFVFSLLI